ncbi:MAG: hypothetical protein NTW30_01800 [Candidatus Aenigmarchaeota archaeon]|nr:hypothetical protein [Candidatus Aenigmarchaeota archaeon]
MIERKFKGLLLELTVETFDVEERASSCERRLLETLILTFEDS